ncbi:hypothetical protein [Leptospira sp. GIMC2001]|uniref:hypothetical protein n=1 Tax=Leptospira sp. GIMC2001 TaxID=1513297 RepID=UPI00234AF222|nr:hypothetical protein [Leptospira sp. GIMC2001]WCL50993.1 hypothetical protein O4O04_09330 [Leptospira sp. GIMC2001]
MSKNYCPSCNGELTFWNTSRTLFEGAKICVSCFMTSHKKKIKNLADLRVAVQAPDPISSNIKDNPVDSNLNENITILSETKGFSFLKACFGFTLLAPILGPMGLLCGLCGSGKTKTTIIKK